MPKMLSKGNRKVMWVPDGGIANVAAPTLSELTAAGTLEVSCLVTAANFSLGPTEDATITDPALCSDDNSTAPGITSYEATMDYFRWTESAEDIAWQTFTDKGIHGFLVQRIGPPSQQAFATGEEVAVFGCLTGTPMNLSPGGGGEEGGGGYQKFRQMYHVQGEEVELRATVS